MATFVFDTHRAVKDLEEAGFPEAQAEALVEIVGAAVGENAATKADLDAMEQRLTARFGGFGRRMGDGFDGFGRRMDARFDDFEHKLESGFRAVRADLRDMERRLTIKFIAILLPSLGLFFAAVRFLS